MAELSPEEKQKIYLEEKERLQAQEKLKKEVQSKTNKQAGIGCLVVIAIIVIYSIISSTKSGSKSSTPSPQDIHLNASVSFTGTQFIIQNNDSFNWTGVKLEINSGLIRSGYSLNVALIEAAQTYTVGALQFAKSDGTRFNPFSMKPQGIFISASTPRGTGYYSGKWGN